MPCGLGGVVSVEHEEAAVRGGETEHEPVGDVGVCVTMEPTRLPRPAGGQAHGLLERPVGHDRRDGPERLDVMRRRRRVAPQASSTGSMKAPRRASPLTRSTWRGSPQTVVVPDDSAIA